LNVFNISEARYCAGISINGYFVILVVTEESMPAECGEDEVG